MIKNPMMSAAIALALLAGCKKEDKPSQTKPDKVEPTEPTKPPEPTEPMTPPAAGDATLTPLAGVYTIDPVHAAVNFRVKHMEISHTLGRFNKVSGSFTLDGDLAKSKVELLVDAASVYTADKKRDDHLKSPDFFNVAQFPSIKFTSTAIKAASDGYEVTGDLELHGVKKSVTTMFQLVGSGPNMMDDKQFLVGFTGELTVKRSDFGMTNMIGPAGDEVLLTIAIEAARK